MLSLKCGLVLRAAVLLCLLPLAGCGASNSSSSQQQVAVTISGSPPSAIGVGANWRYTATVSGTTDQSVTWTLSPTGAGTIDASSGLYIAPQTVPSPATVTISATSPADSTQVASTTVTVQATDPIGTVSGFTPLPSCLGSLPSATCYQMTVSCPGVADIMTYLKVNTPNAAPVGTVLFGVGTGGSGLYDDPASSGFTDGETTVQNVLAGNYNTVQVSFGGPFNPNQPNGWLQGPGGVRRLACRYATVANWVYNNPAIINPKVSVTTSKPMCATGNSGGSGAIAYAVYEYGLEPEFAMTEPTSGPPMTRIDQGCAPCSSSVEGPVCQDSQSVNNPEMCYTTGDASIIDLAYTSNQNPTSGLCTSAVNGTPAPTGLFQSDSILYNPATKIPLPNTTVKLLFGDLDNSNAVPQGMVWGESIAPGPSSPNPIYACVADAGHPIPDVNDGAKQIAADIQLYCH